MSNRKGWTVEPAHPRAGWSVAPASSIGPEAEGIEATPDDRLKPTDALVAPALGAVQGASLNFGDEAMGAADTVLEAGKQGRQALGLESKPPVDADPALNPNTPAIRKSFAPTQPAQSKPVVPEVIEERAQPSLADTYRKARDSYRADNEAAEKAHPNLYGAGEFVGGMSVPIPGPTVTGFLPKVAVGAAKGLGYGVLSGAGKSEADLTRPSQDSVSHFANDVETSGELGAAGGAVGGALEYGVGKLAAKFGNKANAAETALKADDLEEIRNSNLGAMRQKKGEIYRLLERANLDAANPNLEEADRETAKAFLSSPYGRELAKTAARNLMTDAPEQLGGLRAAEEKFAGSSAEAAKKSEDYLAKSTLRADVLPRLAHYGKPIASAAAGGLLSGPVGAGAGALAGAAVGKPSRAIANLRGTPRFQIQTNRTLESALGTLGEGASKAAPVTAVELGEREGTSLPLEDAEGNPLPDLKIPDNILKRRFSR